MSDYGGHQKLRNGGVESGAKLPYSQLLCYLGNKTNFIVQLVRLLVQMPLLVLMLKWPSVSIAIFVFQLSSNFDLRKQDRSRFEMAIWKHMIDTGIVLAE
jgi:hypothetical protein